MFWTVVHTAIIVGVAGFFVYVSRESPHYSGDPVPLGPALIVGFLAALVFHMTKEGIRALLVRLASAYRQRLKRD